MEPTRRALVAARGFTLIEMMIVVAIIAIIGSIAIPQYGEYVLRSRLNETAGALKELRSRMEQRYADNRTYADAGGAACAIGNFTNNDSGFVFTCRLTNGGQGFVWNATGSGRTAGFSYEVDETGIERTLALPAGWTAGTLPVDRLIVKKGG